MDKNSMKTTDCIIVAFDYTHGMDKSVLIVGRKKDDGSVNIINAFQGEEAEALYNKLITKKEQHN